VDGKYGPKGDRTVEQLTLAMQPNLIDFNNNPDGVVRSTSYYVHELFFHNVGDTVVRAEADKSFGPSALKYPKSASRYAVPCFDSTISHSVLGRLQELNSLHCQTGQLWS
jgi:hypothetical protein